MTYIERSNLNVPTSLRNNFESGTTINKSDKKMDRQKTAYANVYLIYQPKV